MAKTLYEKLFDAHVVYEAEGETPILYINRHLIHEVTSPQAFDGLRVAGRQVRQVSKTFGTMDHSISTQVRDVNKLEGQAKIQVLELAKNTKATGIQKVCEMLAISHEDTYAFGDSANDLEMLSYVAHSVAMGNGTDEVKRTAEFVTTGVNEDGIYNGLLHYGLITDSKKSIKSEKK